MKDEFESRAYMQSEPSDSYVVRGWNKHELIVWGITIACCALLFTFTAGYIVGTSHPAHEVRK